MNEDDQETLLLLDQWKQFKNKRVFSEAMEENKVTIVESLLTNTTSMIQPSDYHGFWSLKKIIQSNFKISYVFH